MRRDLEALLNARRRWRSWPAGYRELEISPVGYGISDFAAGAFNDPEQREQLRAVTDAQRRHAQLEEARIDRGRALRVHRGGAAGEDHRCGIPPTHLLGGGSVRDELRVDPRLAHPAGDQLRVLPAEIDHQDGPLFRKRLRVQRNDLSYAGNWARPS